MRSPCQKTWYHHGTFSNTCLSCSETWYYNGTCLKYVRYYHYKNVVLSWYLSKCIKFHKHYISIVHVQNTMISEHSFTIVHNQKCTITTTFCTVMVINSQYLIYPRLHKISCCWALCMSKRVILGQNKLDCGLGFMPIVRVLAVLRLTYVSAFFFLSFSPETAKQLSDPRTNNVCQPTSETLGEPCARGWQT